MNHQDVLLIEQHIMPMVVPEVLTKPLVGLITSLFETTPDQYLVLSQL